MVSKLVWAIVITFVLSVVVDRIWLNLRYKLKRKYSPRLFTYLVIPGFYEWLVAVGFYDMWLNFKQREVIPKLRTWLHRRIKQKIIKRSRTSYKNADGVAYPHTIRTEERKAKQREYEIKLWQENLEAQLKKEEDMRVLKNQKDWYAKHHQKTKKPT